MCRKLKIQVSAAPENSMTDVSLFVEELNLPQEAEEMEAVSYTFGGVESLDGVFSWEGSYSKSAKTQKENKWKRFTGIETREDFAKDAKGGEDNLKHRSSAIAQKQVGSQKWAMSKLSVEAMAKSR